MLDDVEKLKISENPFTPGKKHQKRRERKIMHLSCKL